MAKLPAIESARTDADQLFAPSGVIDASSRNVRGSTPGKRAGVDRVFPLWAFLRGDTMSENQRLRQTQDPDRRRYRRRGGRGGSLHRSLPADGTDTAGTIVPAERYRAPQITAGDVKVGHVNRSRSTQNGRVRRQAASATCRRERVLSAHSSGNLPSGNLPARQRHLPASPAATLAASTSGNLPSGSSPAATCQAATCRVATYAKRQPRHQAATCQAGDLRQRGNLPSGNLPSGQPRQAALCQAATSPTRACPTATCRAATCRRGNLH